MPFPFDNIQTIGILSSATARRGARGLPIIPKQDKQDPPPPPPPPPPPNNNNRIYPNPTPATKTYDYTIYTDPIGPNRPPAFNPFGLDPRDYGYDPNGPDVLPEQDYTDPNPREDDTPIVKDYKPVDPLNTDVAKGAYFKIYRSHFFKQDGITPVDPNTAKTIAEALVKLGEILEDKEIRKILEKIKEDCGNSDLERFLGELLDKPWSDIPFRFIEGQFDKDVNGNYITEIGADGKTYLVGKDLEGNRKLFPSWYTARNDMPDDIDPNVSDPYNPIPIDWDRSGINYIELNLPAVYATWEQKGGDLNIWIMKYMLHELIHSQGGTELEAYYLTNLIIGQLYGEKYVTKIDGSWSPAWDEFRQEDAEIRARDSNVTDLNYFYSKWFKLNITTGEVECRE